MRPGSRRPIQTPSREPPTTNAPWRTNISRAGSRGDANSNSPARSRISWFESSWCERKISHDGNVIRRFFPSPHMSVDIDFDQPVGGLWRQQNVVDADAVVLRPVTALLVPDPL